ncbi:MAG TPA: PspC domain-containing protein [Candidatus Hydrogenedentes bacterium]|nr:PspC domain-containing protein [Candidatus Hydrogenedentota bacterium]HOL76448.1 PspC domain-containing protein [Candidatus Hydrogenedentota bacterium]HPO85487.1 PspC domain-containing protein [Candidatus Hydrogenedentota bacterium]
MRLTEAQRDRINRYLKEVHQGLSDAEPRVRSEKVHALKTRIRQELAKLEDRDVRDEDIEQILAACGAPTQQSVPRYEDDSSRPTGQDDRVWLGVCARLAAQWDLDARVIRIAAVLLGLLPPVLPFLLLTYIGVYVYFYVSAPDSKPKDEISIFGIAKFVLAVFGGVWGVYLCGVVLIEFIARSTFKLLAQPLALSSRWTWLEREGAGWFFWMLFTLLPLSALSALPVPPAWASTLRKVVYAVLALYAVLVCFGVASYLVGTIFFLAEHGLRIEDWIPSF